MRRTVIDGAGDGGYSGTHMRSPELDGASSASSPVTARARSRSAVYEEIINEATRAYFKTKSTADMSSSSPSTTDLKLPVHLIPQEATVNEMRFPPIRVVNRPSDGPASTSTSTSTSGSASPLPPPKRNSSNSNSNGGHRKSRKQGPTPYSVPFVMPSA